MINKVRELQGRDTHCSQRVGLACLAFALAASAPAQTATETTLHNFATPPKGANPQTGVIRDNAGNLYGTTYNGGTSGLGVAYRVTAAGQLMVLHNFTGGTDGKNPWGGLVRDSSGNLYGTTYYGGAHNAGVVYKLDPTGVETLLYTFTGGSDGGYPIGNVTRDSAGNIYGTTELGGIPFRGVVYKIDTTGNESVLYAFSGGNDGSEPTAGVILDPTGNLYGTTYYGGPAGEGVVFEVDTTGHESVLYSFTGATDGGAPWAGVVRDSSGNLYGTTNNGGTSNSGVVYEVDTAGHETVLHSFSGSGGDFPNAGVVRDSSGRIYGTTYSGGASGGWGVVYRLSATGRETVLHSFTDGADGAYPAWAGLVLDSSGNVYGTTGNGGVANAGTVFEVDSSGNETVIASFPGSADGSNPYAGLIRDSSGNFYGTASTGGASGWGIVYKLDTTGHETVLYTFTGGADGGEPRSGVVRDSAGNMYGTTYSGGASGWGTVYKLDSTGNETVLHSFTLGVDGGFPVGGVILDSAGNLYGTTLCGVASGSGLVFEIDPAGIETELYSFTGGADGGYPYAGVARDSAGNLYGTGNIGGASSLGVVFKVDTSGTETVLHSFGGADGSSPYSGVILDSSGNLYGTTYYGGANSLGAVYKVDSTGVETVLYSFDYTDGGYPEAGVIRDSAGNLYGTTYQGGATGLGTVFKLSAAGTETVVYSFTGGTDGGNPYAGVITDSSGNFYGTTYKGGAKSAGVVYKIHP